MSSAEAITGRLHCIVAFDWGESVNFERAAELVRPEKHVLPRRRRTPAAIAYRPPPLRFDLGSAQMPVPSLSSPAQMELVAFDFGAVSFSIQISFALGIDQLRQLASELAESDWLLNLAKEKALPLYERLRTAIDNPKWSEEYEEYLTFQLDPHPALFAGGKINPAALPALIAMLRLDNAEFSEDEVGDALRCRISYEKHDVVIIDWPAAVVIDCDCEDTLQTIEFANVQLLEYRCLDKRVDEALAAARRQIALATQSRLQFWRTHALPLRILNEMRLDAVGTFERAGSTLQLVGDQYLSRLYRLASDRFHLPQWADKVRQALDVAEDVHQTLLSQSSMYRLELLEITIVALILVEMALAIL